MSLHCWNILSHKVGQATSKKFPIFYNHTGHSERNLQQRMALSWKAQELLFQTRSAKLFLSSSHEGHLGLNKYKLHAKDIAYWPGLNEQLERMILSCELCLKCSQSKCKQQPSMSLEQEIPLHPWSKLVADIFHFEGASYLLIVDYTHRFPVVCKLSSMTGQHVASQCKADILWVSLARYFGFWKWTLLHHRNFYKYDERVWCQSHYNLSTLSVIQWIGRKVCPICQELFYGIKEEGRDTFKGLMIYGNTALSSSLQSLMQILQSRTARLNLPMSNAARNQLGLGSELLRNKHKNEHLPSYVLQLGQDVMFQMQQVSGDFKLPLQACVTTKKLQDYYKGRCHL